MTEKQIFKYFYKHFLTLNTGSGSERDTVSFSQRMVQFSQLRTSDGGAEHNVCKASYLTYNFKNIFINTQPIE